MSVTQGPILLLDGNGNPIGSNGSGRAVNVYITGGGGSGGTSSTFGQAFPSLGTAIGASDGTDMQPLLVDGSGNLKIAGSFSASTPSSNTASAAEQTVIGTTAAQVVAANPSRKGFSMQNLGTTVLKLVLGAGTPTQTVYHVSLPACGNQNDGSSPAYYGPPGLLWTGAIQIISSAAGGIYTFTELT